jgi:transposase
MQSISTNPRKIRGLDIFKRYTIKEKDGFWFVPSTSGRGIKYKVDLSKQLCDCPDYEIRRQKCKHLFAAESAFEKEVLESLTSDDAPLGLTLFSKRKTYSQDWTVYNKSQTCEKSEFQKLLVSLCKGIGEPSQTNGRPRIAFEDIIFACVFKVFSTYSARRFTTDLQDAQSKGFISSPIHYNTLLRYFEDEMLTPYLKMLVEESSLPLASLEKNFAVDASGLSTTTGFTWLHAKFTEPRLIDKKDWLKIHICVGTLTHTITAIEVTERYEHDTNFFAPLVETTAQNFEMEEISADKAYLSKANLQTAVDNNAFPYIAWKSNSKISLKPENELWNKFFHYFSLNREKFIEYYHKRSNVETAFSMIKAKFGGSLRSRNRTAQINEALCKVLAHNLCVLNQSMNELEIKPEFWKEIV